MLIFSCHVPYLARPLTLTTTYHIFLPLPHTLQNIYLFLACTYFTEHLPFPATSHISLPHAIYIIAWLVILPATYHSFLPLRIFCWPSHFHPVAIWSLIFISGKSYHLRYFARPLYCFYHFSYLSATSLSLADNISFPTTCYMSLPLSISL